MKIKYYSNPLNENFKEIEVSEYKNCDELIKSSGLSFAEYIIYIDDKTYNYPECGQIEIPESAIVSIMLKIENGKGFVDYIKNPLTIITAAVAVALLFVPGANLIGITMLLSVGTGALSSLFTPPLPDVNANNSVGKNKYSISGAQNETQLNSVFPMVLGQARVFPPYVANYYVALDDKTAGDGEQYLYALLNLGYKDLKVSNIKMGDTLIATNTADVRNGYISIDGGLAGITAEIRQNGTIPVTYGTPRKMTQLNAVVKQEDMQTFVYTTPKNTQKITIGLQFNGLFKQNSDGGLDDATVTMAYYYRKAGTLTWNTPQGAASENVYIINSQTVSYGLFGVYKIKIPKQTVRGSTFKVSTNDGYKDGKIVAGNMQILTPDGWKDVTYNTSTIVGSGAITEFTNNTKDVLRYEIDILPTEADITDNPDYQWDIMVQRLTADDRTSYNDAITWTYAVYEMGGIIMQQTQLDKVCLLALKIQANEITQANLNKINAICQMVAPVYNSETETWSDSTPIPTSNPAAIMRKVLKGSYMNKAATDSLIDYTALNKLYTFCETNSYMCNGVISEQETLTDILQKVLGTCRTEFYIKNGMYSCVIDDVQPTPVAILSPKNTSDFTWTRQFGEKIACYSIKYQNADQNYEDIIEDVYPIGEMEADGDLKQDLNIWGVNNHEQAFKIGRYLHAANKLRRELYNLSIPIEHFALSKGQRVLLSHDVISVGIIAGNIKSYDSGTNSITVDEILSVTDPLKTYGIQISTDLGVVVIPCEVELIGNTIHLLEEPTISITSGMIYALGETDKITEDCIVKSKTIEQSPQLKGKLELVPYAPEIFTADTTPVPDFDANITDTSFDISMIATGEAATIGKIIGSSVKDDGILYFDFTPEDRYFDDWRPSPTNTNRLYNYGANKEYGDAIVTDNLTYTYDSLRDYYFVSSSDGGKFTANADVALYGNFNISTIIKGTPPVSKEVLIDCIDNTYYLHFTLYFENEKLYLSIQDIVNELTGIDYSKFPDGTFISIDYLSTDLALNIYQDGVFVQMIEFGTSFEDEGVYTSEPVDLEDEGTFSAEPTDLEDEGIYESSILGKSHVKPITFLSDEAGLYPCSSMSMSQLRIYSDTVGASGISKLYLYNELYINVNAQSRYLGALETAPVTGFLYEYFLYLGANTDDYMYGSYYQRTLNGWRLLKLDID